MSVINGPYPPDPPADGLPPLSINPRKRKPLRHKCVTSLTL